MNTNKKNPHVLKMLTFVMLSLLFLLLLGHGLFGKKGYQAVRNMKQQNEELNHKIEQLKSENSQTMEEIRALKSDPRTIERIAREELGLVRPGEIKITPARPEASSKLPPAPPSQESP
jgi:cell division protein FtsB